MEKENNHNEIIRAIGRIEGTITGIDKNITEGFSRIDSELKTHTDSIGILMTERDQNKGGLKVLNGIWILISAFGAVFVDHLLFRK